MPTRCSTLDTEKQKLLDSILGLSRGSRAEAIQYLENIKKATSPEVVQIGVRLFVS
jgi:hypothetical protein